MPDMKTSMLRGLRGACPACGQGRLFAGFLSVARECPHCRAPLGEVRAEVRDVSGRRVGELVTRQPNVLGETRTEVRDLRGRRIGDAVSRSPNALGETKTVFRDPSGRETGRVTTRSPNALGDRKSVIEGQLPLLSDPSVKPRP